MPNDFLVQTLELTLGAGVASAVFPIPIAIDTTRTRVMNMQLTGVQAPVVGAVGSVSAKDLGVAIKITSANQVTLRGHPGRAYPTSVRFSLLSYIGPVGGPNEFIVTSRFDYQTTEFASPISGQELSFNSLGLNTAAYAKTTAHLTGACHLTQGTDWTTPKTSTLGLIVGVIDLELGTPGDDMKIKYQGDNTFGARRWEIEVVHWVGSNWTIARPNTGPGRSAEKFQLFDLDAFILPTAKPINEIGAWDRTWIETSLQPASYATTEHMHSLIGRPGSTTQDLIVEPPQNTFPAAGGRFWFHAISNPDVYVFRHGISYLNRTTRLGSGEQTKTIPLATPNLISKGVGEVIVIPGGFIDEFEDHAISQSYKTTLPAGFSDVTAIFVAPGSVRVDRTLGLGWQYEDFQIVQFNGTIRPSSDPELRAIQLPRWSVNIVNA